MLRAIILSTALILIPVTGFAFERDKGFQCAPASQFHSMLLGWIPMGKSYSERYGGTARIWISQHKRYQIIIEFSAEEWCRVGWGKDVEFLELPNAG